MKTLTVLNGVLILASLILAIATKNFSAACGWITAAVWFLSSENFKILKN